jgi:glycolate oxidase iron-sulfur subunit
LTRILPKQIRDLEAMLPRLPQRPLRRILPKVTGSRGETKQRVGFFLGCAQSLLFADESAATVRVLSRNGCTVITPKEVECCGMPAHGYGRMDLVRKQAKRNISVFEKSDVDVVVTDCATCGSTLKEYGDYLKDDPKWAERAEEFSHKVRDVSEFLGEIPLEKPKGRIQKRVTYHDPCHLRRAQHVTEQPRDLLKMIAGLEFVELPESDWCCGSAGSQLITHYETSTQVLDRKMDNLESTQARVIASGCPGCQMQLNTGIQRRGLDVRVVHPISLLDEAYEASDE